MNKKKTDNGSLDEEYVARVTARLEEASAAPKIVARAWHIARSGEEHFKRIEFTVKRHMRAKAAGDKTALPYENQVLAALLYEIADTGYLVLAMLDFDKLELDSSEDGRGLVGEVAPDVVRILDLLDNQAIRLLEIEKLTGVKMDFSTAVDEKLGITFVFQGHWHDMIPGSVKDSFYTYFRQAAKAVRARLAQKPDFWAKQTVRQYLETKRYHALLKVLLRLECEALKAA